MKKHTGKIWRGLATTTASLLTITLGGSSIANARVDFINATLGTSSYKIEQGDSDSDGIYYESEFDNVEDLVKAKEQLAAEISSEGSVYSKIILSLIASLVKCVQILNMCSLSEHGNPAKMFII